MRRRKPIHAPSIEVVAPPPDSTLDPSTYIDDTEDYHKSCKEKIVDAYETFKDTFEDLTMSLVQFLNDASHDYRTITQQLDKEKKERSRASFLANPSLLNSSETNLQTSRERSSKNKLFDKVCLHF